MVSTTLILMIAVFLLIVQIISAMKIKYFFLPGLLIAMKKYRSMRPIYIILIQQKIGKCECFQYLLLSHDSAVIEWFANPC